MMGNKNWHGNDQRSRKEPVAAPWSTWCPNRACGAAASQSNGQCEHTQCEGCGTHFCRGCANFKMLVREVIDRRVDDSEYDMTNQSWRANAQSEYFCPADVREDAIRLLEQETGANGQLKRVNRHTLETILRGTRGQGRTSSEVYSHMRQDGCLPPGEPHYSTLLGGHNHWRPMTVRELKGMGYSQREAELYSDDAYIGRLQAPIMQYIQDRAANPQRMAQLRAQ